ncbi:PucR-like helix-turn-helix protein [Antricoccus suffuscus]|uniref:PucR-like helix-turn-helix protein n=1 Tax=Antricoccus suffuscus TaxID=1629062 RepID=A0A2T0ZW07_9ACTN|nr:helix-turn-helix domain-containing protein [Antricoccus suffuscus]PRZ40530.1 PucR-like helix-turn-helix protein [Antricoccus suffuscus]
MTTTDDGQISLGGDPPPEILRLAAQAAGNLNARQTDITDSMTELLAGIEYLVADQHLRDLMQASIEGNVKTIFHVIANQIPIDHLQASTAAVEYALRLAQRGISANSLIRAYHMGQDNLLAAFFDESQRLDCDADLKVEVMHYVSSVLYQYIDWICVYLLDVYEEEQRRWSTTTGNVSASLIHKILSNEAVNVATFAKETGYSLDQFHVGIVLWTPGADPAHEEVMMLERFARDLATQAQTSSPPIFTAIDRNTGWAWLPMGKTAKTVTVAEIGDLVERTNGGRVSIGLPGYGVSGFRRTHEEAEATKILSLASAGHVPNPVSYGDPGVAIVSVLTRDLDTTRSWIYEVLGPLADNTPSNERLRETLQCFLRTGGSYTQSSELLHLHRNSVKYRVAKALEERGRPLTVDRLDVEVALQACQFLGSAVLHTAK